MIGAAAGSNVTAWRCGIGALRRKAAGSRVISALTTTDEAMVIDTE